MHSCCSNLIDATSFVKFFGPWHLSDDIRLVIGVPQGSSTRLRLSCAVDGVRSGGATRHDAENLETNPKARKISADQWFDFSTAAMRLNLRNERRVSP